MLIVNPSFGESGATEELIATRSVDWRVDPIVLFSNSKPNARELLEGVRVSLSGIRATDNIGFVYKSSASETAPAEIYDQVAEGYSAALLAIAD